MSSTVAIEVKARMVDSTGIASRAPSALSGHTLDELDGEDQDVASGVFALV